MMQHITRLFFIGDAYASQRARMIRALLAVLASLVAASESGAFLDGLHGAANGFQMVASVARYSVALDDPQRFQDLGDEAEGLVLDLFKINAGIPDITWDQVPEDFVSEFFDPAELGCSNAMHAPGTVGMICDGDGERVLEYAVDLLEEKGWAAVPGSAEDFCVTLVKESGHYRWAYMTCSEISGTVTISISFQNMDGTERT